VPIVTRAGTFVLQAAGKAGFECFSLMDEELFVLCGQQFVNMMMQYDLLRHRTGLLQIMNVDEEKINLSYLTEAVVELSGAERGSIFMVDEGSNELVFMADTQSGEKHETRIPLSKDSIAGSAVLHNETINLNDCYTDERFDSNVDILTGYQSKQMLCVPVNNDKGQAIGAIQLINTKHGRGFTELNCEIIRGFRMYVQIAILNHKAAAYANSAVRRRIAELDARDLSLERLVEVVVELSQAARGTIFVVDEIAQELYFIIDTPTGEKKQVSIPLTTASLAGASIINNEIINIADCYTDPRFDNSMDKQTGLQTRQLLCVPVTNAAGKVIGAIQIMNTHHGMPFGKETCMILEAFRVYAQVGILHNKMQTAGMADSEAHVEVSMVDSQEIDLGYLADLVIQICRAQQGFIFVLDDTSSRLSYLSPGDKKEESIACSQRFLAGAVAMTNQVINMEDCSTDLRYNTGTDRGDFESKQALAVPVVGSNGETFGAIQVVNSHNGEPFNDNTIEVLQAFRVYIQVAIVNHRKRVAARALVSDALAKAPEGKENDLGFFTDAVVGLSKSARGAIYVVNKHTNELAFLAGEHGVHTEITIPLSAESVAGASVVHNEVINISNCYDDTRFNTSVDEYTGFKSRQMLCVPVAGDDATGDAIGAIQVINTHDGLPFGPEEFELLKAFRPFVRSAVLEKQKEFDESMKIDPSGAVLRRKSVSISRRPSVDPTASQLAPAPAASSEDPATGHTALPSKNIGTGS